MIEVAKNQFEIYQYHQINENTENTIDVKKTHGNINWEKLINCMCQFAHTPDDHIPLQGK